MKKCISLTICGLLLSAVAAVPARAQFYLGVRGGLSNQNAKVGELDFDSSSAFLYGGQAGIKFLGLAIEGQFYRADHDLPGDAQPDDVEQPMDYYYLGVNGKLGISIAVFYPYITVGYGTYSVNLKGLGKDSDGAFNIGAGAELTLGKLGIFAELKYTDFDVEIESLEWDFGGLDLHFGLNLHF
jgi:hypothetical protein